MNAQGKKILMVPKRLPYSHSFLEEMYTRILPSRGWNVTWYTEEKAPGEPMEEKDFNGTRVLAYPRAGSRFLENPHKKHCLRSLLQSGEFDIFQVRNDWKASAAGRPVCRRLGIPLVFQKSFPDEDFYIEQVRISKLRLKTARIAAKRLEKRAAYREIGRADWIFPISEHMKRAMAEMGLPAEKMTPMPLGFDCSLKPEDLDGVEIRERLGLGERPVALYFGSMSPLRGLDILIKAFAVAAKHIPQARLLMVGGDDAPDNREALKNLAAKVGAGDRIIFHPQIPRREMLGFIRASDFTVSPIQDIPVYRVSSPTKVVESLALGRAALVTELPDQSLMIRESGAGISVPFQEAALARGLEKMLLDRNLCAEMGARGRGYIEKNRDYNKMADVIEEIYSRLLARRG